MFKFISSIIQIAAIITLFLSSYVIKENAKLINKLKVENNTLLENCISSPLQEQERDYYK
jgi:hypothetical protein